MIKVEKLCYEEQKEVFSVRYVVIQKRGLKKHSQ